VKKIGVAGSIMTIFWNGVRATITHLMHIDLVAARFEVMR